MICYDRRGLWLQALPDTMKLCLGGAGAANAPYDLNASSCFSLDEISADPTTGSVNLKATMPGPAAWVQWSADPYPECALLNDAGLPASPFAAKLALKTEGRLKSDDDVNAPFDFTLFEGELFAAWQALFLVGDASLGEYPL